MNIKILGFGIALLTLTSFGVLYYMAPILNERVLDGEGNVACTADAKMCPDGSAVGRVGPNCEFAACPLDDNAAQASSTDSKVHVGESASALGVSITPLEVVEDSRCPSDVQCIWAGRIRVRVQLVSGLGISEQLFEFNKPITTEAEIVELVSVLPATVSTEEIATGQYVFTFRVTKR